MAGSGTGPTIAGKTPLGRLGRLACNVGIYLSNLILRPLSRLAPRDPRLWAFGAPGGRFEGNAKYLFLWAAHRHGEARCVWISESGSLARHLRALGYEAHWRWSPRGMARAVRAGFFFVNDNSSDINFALGGGARIFNLWHGVGLKNVGRGARVGFNASLLQRERNPFFYVRNMRRFERPAWILATSQATAESFFARCFGVPPSRAPALGYPRLDPMVDDELKQLALSFDCYDAIEAAARAFSRVILYAPTVRTDDAALLAEALPDLRRISDALAAQDAALLLKLHPRSMPQHGWASRLPDNIRLLPEDLDIYPVLDRIDALITDYSSLFFDYISFRSSGVVLYTFDFDRYVARDRDLAWDYGEVTVGARANTFDELCRLIRSGEVFAPLWPDKLEWLRHRFWDGTLRQAASERILGYVSGRAGLPLEGAPCR